MSSTWQPATVYHLKQDFFSTFQYRVSAVLGQGCFGEVLLATSLTEGRPERAVKRIPRRLPTGQNVDMKPFLEEAKALFNLKHHRVLNMYGAAICPDFAYIVMDVYSSGNLLQNILLLDFGTICRYMVDISMAVHYLHKNRVVHKDIKLNNILIDDSNHAILADLGMTRQFPTSLEKTTAMFGNFYYRAPEMKAEPLQPYCPFKVS